MPKRIELTFGVRLLQRTAILYQMGVCFCHGMVDLP